MTKEYSTVFLVSLLTISIAFSVRGGSSPELEDIEIPRDKSLKANQLKSMKVRRPKVQNMDSFKALVEESQQILKESKKICGTRGQAEHQKRRLLLSEPNAAPLKLSNHPHDELFSELLRVMDVASWDAKVAKKANWVILEGGSKRGVSMDLILASGERYLPMEPGDTFVVTAMSGDSAFRSGIYGEENYRPGSLDYLLDGTVLEHSVSKKLVYVSAGNSFLKIKVDSKDIEEFRDCIKVRLLFQKLLYLR